MKKALAVLGSFVLVFAGCGERGNGEAASSPTEGPTSLVPSTTISDLDMSTARAVCGGPELMVTEEAYYGESRVDEDEIASIIRLGRNAGHPLIIEYVAKLMEAPTTAAQIGIYWDFYDACVDAGLAKRVEFE
jgi:hypothetical protein